MRPLSLARAADRAGKAALFLACLSLPGGAASARQGADRSSPESGNLSTIMNPSEELYLDVVVNGYRPGLLAAFHRYRDGCLGIGMDDLRQLNLKAPEVALHGGEVCLEKMPGLAYRYDAPTQTIYLTVSDDVRIPLRFDARGRSAGAPVPSQDRDFSAIFNYALTANFGSEDWRMPVYQGVGVSADAHLFTRHGDFDQSFVLRTSPVEGSGPDFLRLDSLWSYGDAASATLYAAGDIVSGSFGWTRALRMGGFQVRRDFTLQPGLVTQPVPQLSGSAAVPSTVEVFANQSRAFSQEVNGGPFIVNNLPLLSGPTTMRLVVRDPSGRETATEYSYYSSPLLAAPGLLDYSIEGGFARTFYGTLSDSYDGNPIASGSFRYGLTPELTLLGHAEGGAGLVNGGGSANFSLWHLGVASLSIQGSEKGGAFGAQVSGSIETALWGVRLYAQSLRALGDYQDLVSVTAPRLALPAASGPITAAQSGAPYLRQDQFSASIPLPFDRSAINFSFTSAKDYNGAGYQLGSVSYSRQFLWDNSTLSLTAYNDFENRGNCGAFIGLSFTWDRVSAGALAQTSGSSASGGGFVSRALDLDPGSYGYTVRSQQGAVATNSAAVAYRTSSMLLQAGVQQSGNAAQATAQAEGSVAILNGVYFANRIDNSFAVVETGMPGVKVLYENHPAGESDADGKLLIPQMRAREANIISIDPASIPVQADIDSLEQKAVPAQRGGMSVHFKGNAQPASALAVFKDEKGAALPHSSEVWVNGAPAPFVIGYDGEAYLTGLALSNTALVRRPDGTSCNAAFTFTPLQGAQVRIEDIVCKPGETAQPALVTMAKTGRAER